MKGFALSLTALLASVVVAGADVRLDQLSACDSLAQVREYLRAFPRQCRAPAGVLERSIARRVRDNPDVKVCFIARAPSTALAEFSCLVADLPPDQRQVICFREAEATVSQRFRQQYETVFRNREIQYLERASKCSTGNGDAARAARTLFPALLSLIARFDFGYVLPMGGAFVGSGLIVHGYGSVDPDLQSGVSALEFFAMSHPR